jgi:polyhydroxyalkanoate synthesis regulator phasin
MHGLRVGYLAGILVSGHERDTGVTSDMTEQPTQHERMRQTMELLQAGELSAGEASGYVLAVLQECEEQIARLESTKTYARAAIAHILAEYYDNQPARMHGCAVSYQQPASYTRVDVPAFRRLLASLEERQPDIAEALRACITTSERSGHVKIDRKPQKES